MGFSHFQYLGFSLLYLVSAARAYRRVSGRVMATALALFFLPVRVE